MHDHELADLESEDRPWPTHDQDRYRRSEPDPAVRTRWIIPAAVVFLWFAGGTNYLAVRVVAEALPPLLIVVVRLVVSVALLAPLVAWRLRDRPPPTGRQLGSAAIMGLLLLAIGQTLLTFGISRLPAGIAAVLGSSAPLFVALFAWAILREPLSRQQVAGVGLGFAGLVLIAAGVGMNGDFDLLGAVLVLLFAAAWAAGSLYGSRADLPDDVIITLFVQLLVASVPVMIAAALAGDLRFDEETRLDARAWAALAFTIVVGSVMTFGIFTWVNRAVSSTVANSMAYVAPVIALTLSAWFLGEAVTVRTITAAAVVLVGVTLMVSHRKSVVSRNSLKHVRAAEENADGSTLSGN